MFDFAPASKNFKSSLFWYVTQRTLVFTDISEPPIGPLTETSVTTNLLRVTSQKSEDLVCTVAEA